MADSIIFCGYSKVRFGTKPAGAYVVANTFRSMNLSSVVVDHAFSMKWSDMTAIIDKFVDKNTKFVCLSTTLLGPPGSVINVMSECDRLFKPFMEYIKDICPTCIFIVGGSKITRGEKSELPFDYIVKGQAEQALRAIIAHELRGDVLIHENGMVTDKVYGFDSFNTNDWLKFTKYDGVLANETLPAELGRGCVFKCAFCDYDLIGKNFGDYNKTEDTFYSILMSNYEQFGTTRYQLSDDTLNDSEEKIDRLWRISKRLPFQLEFGAYLRVELLEKIKDAPQKLLEAGLRGANLGIETLNKDAGASVGKGYGMNAISALKNARKYWGDAVSVNINIIVGLPHDDEKSLRNQHEILVNGDFLDHVFYTPLSIPKKGESLFSKGLYKKYYAEVEEMHPIFVENIKKYESTATFFRENINWKSEVLNVCDAILLAREFQSDFSCKRPYVVNNVTSFCIMSLLESFSMNELRSLRYDDMDDKFTQMSRNKIQKYVALMLSDNTVVPSTEMTPLLNFDKILPVTGFESKIKIPIRLNR